MTRRARRRIAIIGVGGSLRAAGIAPASAHYVYQQGDVYDSPGFDQCVHVYAETSHGESGDGYMKGSVSAYKSYTSADGSRVDCQEAQTTGEGAGVWERPSENIQ